MNLGKVDSQIAFQNCAFEQKRASIENYFHFRSIYQITIPFGKESPFLLPIRKTLDKMRERGILQEIIKQRYETFTKTECGESKVRCHILIIAIEHNHCCGF